MKDSVRVVKNYKRWGILCQITPSSRPAIWEILKEEREEKISKKGKRNKRNEKLKIIFYGTEC